MVRYKQSKRYIQLRFIVYIQVLSRSSTGLDADVNSVVDMFTDTATTMKIQFKTKAIESERFRGYVESGFWSAKPKSEDTEVADRVLKLMNNSLTKYTIG